MFIVLEGIDGAGKSSQIAALTSLFQRYGHSVVTCADPGTTAAGMKIRELLLGQHEIAIAPRTELLLFMAARSQLVAEVIQPALDRNQVVICDRYLLSSVVYQGYLGQIPPEEIWQMGQLVVGSTVPEITLLLDLPASVAATRTSRQLDRIESRGQDYLENVRRSFLREAAKHPQAIQVIDATQSVAEVSQQIEKQMRPWLVQPS